MRNKLHFVGNGGLSKDSVGQLEDLIICLFNIMNCSNSSDFTSGWNRKFKSVSEVDHFSCKDFIQVIFFEGVAQSN